VSAWGEGMEVAPDACRACQGSCYVPAPVIPTRDDPNRLVQLCEACGGSGKAVGGSPLGP
jgi:hypothetical protein